MSKRLIDYCNSHPSSDNAWSLKIMRYFLVETYLRENHQTTIWSYQSGKHPNCSDIDKYMQWKAHATEKIVNGDGLFTRRKTHDGWVCKELSWQSWGCPRPAKEAEQEAEKPKEIDWSAIEGREA